MELTLEESQEKKLVAALSVGLIASLLLNAFFIGKMDKSN